MASNGQKNLGIKGFVVKKRRNRRGTPRYPVLARLKNWVDPYVEGFQPDPHHCHMGLIRRCRRCREETLSWDIRWVLGRLPTFRGVPGEDPRLHVAKLWNTVRELKPEWVSMEAAWLMAFPSSLMGLPDEWFSALPRKEYMTWAQVRDCFIAQYYWPGFAFM